MKRTQKDAELMAELKKQYKFNPGRGNLDFECALTVKNAEALKSASEDQKETVTYVFVTQGQVEGASTNKPERRLRLLIHLITHFPDIESAYLIRKNLSGPENAAAIANYIDWRGNNILWYLAYRDDQQAQGGFACPRIEHELLQLGADPSRRNNIGLCWNDVRRHLIRTEV